MNKTAKHKVVIILPNGSREVMQEGFGSLELAREWAWRHERHLTAGKLEAM